MKEWAEVHELLSGGLSDFLSEALPEIGGDGWWQNYVVEQLTPGQARSISTLNVGELRVTNGSGEICTLTKVQVS
jgi:hypothetical protein